MGSGSSETCKGEDGGVVTIIDEEDSGRSMVTGCRVVGFGVM